MSTPIYGLQRRILGGSSGLLALALDGRNGGTGESVLSIFRCCRVILSSIDVMG